MPFNSTHFIYPMLSGVLIPSGIIILFGLLLIVALCDLFHQLFYCQLPQLWNPQTQSTMAWTCMDLLGFRIPKHYSVIRIWPASGNFTIFVIRKFFPSVWRVVSGYCIRPAWSLPIRMLVCCLLRYHRRQHQWCIWSSKRIRWLAFLLYNPRQTVHWIQNATHMNFLKSGSFPKIVALFRFDWWNSV